MLRVRGNILKTLLGKVSLLNKKYTKYRQLHFVSSVGVWRCDTWRCDTWNYVPILRPVEIIVTLRMTEWETE